MSPAERSIFGVFLIVVVMLFWMALPKDSPAPVIELHNVKVWDEVGQYAYWLELEDGHRVYALFCNDFMEPPFSEGMIIDLLKVENMGGCWSMRNTHPKWIMRRDGDGNEVHFARSRRSGPGTAQEAQAGRPGTNQTTTLP